MTEAEAKNMYADMIEAYAEKGAPGVESMILALGRTDMHVLCAYLFVRSLDVDMAKYAKGGVPEVKLDPSYTMP